MGRIVSNATRFGREDEEVAEMRVERGWQRRKTEAMISTTMARDELTPAEQVRVESHKTALPPRYAVVDRKGNVGSLCRPRDWCVLSMVRARLQARSVRRIEG